MNDNRTDLTQIPGLVDERRASKCCTKKQVQATGPWAFELAIENPVPVSGVSLALKENSEDGRIVSAIAAEATQMLGWKIEFNETHVHAEGKPEQDDDLPYAVSYSWTATSECPRETHFSQFGDLKCLSMLAALNLK